MSNHIRKENPAVVAPQWREGERSEPDRNGGATTAARVLTAPAAQAQDAPDPEVSEKAIRRRFSAKYKLKILREADACTKPGELGALLRREGLYYSILQRWRNQREKGELKELSARKRGKKSNGKDETLVKENRKLRRENEQLKKRLKQAETIIEVQKKISEIMGIPLKADESGESD